MCLRCGTHRAHQWQSFTATLYAKNPDKHCDREGVATMRRAFRPQQIQQT